MMIGHGEAMNSRLKLQSAVPGMCNPWRRGIVSLQLLQTAMKESYLLEDPKLITCRPLLQQDYSSIIRIPFARI